VTGGLRLHREPISPEKSFESRILYENGLPIVGLLVLPVNRILLNQPLLRDSECDEVETLLVLFQSVDRVEAVQYHLCLAGVHFWEHQARTVAQGDTVCQLQSLKVLGLSRHARNPYLFFAEDSIDHARLSDVRVADKSDFYSLFPTVLLEELHKLLGREHCTRVFVDRLLAFLMFPLLGCEEAVVDPLLEKVLVPFVSALLRHEIAFVDDQKEPALPDLLCVLEEILTKEEERVPAVDDLHEDLAPFDNPPELSPDLKVLFVWSDGEILLSLLDFSQSPPPR
jgi:hypothetical protein